MGTSLTQEVRVRVSSFVLALMFCLIGNCAIAENTKMIFAIDLIRHGDRSPMQALPSAPHKSQQGFGQLSPEGMAQEFKLGTELRERYIDHYHLLPPDYLAETMHVRSSDIDRTLMSAECALMGLYPPGQGPFIVPGKPALPGQYQPIPIHTKPRGEDSLLIVDSNGDLGTVIDKYSHASSQWNDHTAKVQSQFDRWSELLGTTISNLSQVDGLGNVLHIFQLHHVPLPKGMTDADAAEIIEAGELAFADTFRPHEVGDCGGHNLLASISDYLEQASQHKTKLKYVLFSSHDTTIASVMSAMRTPVDRRPRYASDLNFALFEDGPNLTVKVTFNGEPVPILGAKDGACTLAQFHGIVNSKN